MPRGALKPEALRAAALFRRGQASRYLALQRKIIAAGHNLEDVVHLTVDAALELLPHAGAAAVELLEGDILELAACSGSALQHLGYRIPVPGSFSGLCLETRKPIICVDASIDPRVDRTAYEQVGLRSVMVVPIIVHGTPRGVLKIMSALPNAFGEDELLLAELLAGPIIIGLSARTAREAAREKLLAEQRFRATFEHAAVGIVHVDTQGRLLMVNDKFCQIVGRDMESLLGGSYRDITHPDDREESAVLFDALVRGAVDSYTVEKRYIRPTGMAKWTRLTASAVRNAEGAIDYCVSIIEDIGKQKQAQQEMLADPLTSLPNRRWLTQNLPSFLERNKNENSGLGIAFIDLDDFKSVNDRFGHDAGDRCLIGAADSLRAQIGESGTVVHLSGDEFVVILEATDEDSLEGAGRRIQKAIRKLAKLNDWPIDASIGTVFIPGGRPSEPFEVLKLADSMMYSAKRAGGGRQMFAALDRA